MAQAKLTVSKAQALVIGRYTHRKKPVSCIIYDPLSGVNLYETKEGEYIEVPDGANLTNLVKGQLAGMFRVIEGYIIPVTTRLSGVTYEADTGILTLVFNQPVTSAGLTASALPDADLIISYNGAPLDATFEGVTNSLTMLATIDTDLDEPFEVQLTAAGAAKVFDSNNSVIEPWFVQLFHGGIEAFSITVGEDTFEAYVDNIADSLNITTDMTTVLTAATINFTLGEGCSLYDSTNTTELVSGTTTVDFSNRVVAFILRKPDDTTEEFSCAVYNIGDIVDPETVPISTILIDYPTRTMTCTFEPGVAAEITSKEITNFDYSVENKTFWVGADGTGSVTINLTENYNDMAGLMARIALVATPFNISTVAGDLPGTFKFQTVSIGEDSYIEVGGNDVLEFFTSEGSSAYGSGIDVANLVEIELNPLDFISQGLLTFSESLVAFPVSSLLPTELTVTYGEDSIIWTIVIQ
jgi:hypothetical protein